MISSPLLRPVSLRCLLLWLVSLTLTLLSPVLLPLCAVTAPALRGWPRKLAGTTPALWGWPRNPTDRTLLTLSLIESGLGLNLL